jgi:membrane-associated phospholipid phosphatase
MKFGQVRLSHPADVGTILYQIVMILVVIFHLQAVPYSGYLLLYHVFIIAFVLVLPNLGYHPSLKWIRDWNPLLIIPTSFAELHYLVHSVSPVDLDDFLIHADHAIFGVHPTVWLERLTFAPLTEYFQWIYTTFYFLPLIMGFILYRKDDLSHFHLFVFLMVFGFYASYLGYFIVPAIGPRFTLAELQTIPLEGVWLADAIRHTLNVLENIQRDAFPSGHTEVTLLIMMYARQHARRYFLLLNVIGTSLIISTVYLRYHYVIDVAAGIILAILIWYAAPYLYRKISDAKSLKFNSF